MKINYIYFNQKTILFFITFFSEQSKCFRANWSLEALFFLEIYIMFLADLLSLNYFALAYVLRTPPNVNILLKIFGSFILVNFGCSYNPPIVSIVGLSESSRFMKWCYSSSHVRGSNCF